MTRLVVAVAQATLALATLVLGLSACGGAGRSPGATPAPRAPATRPGARAVAEANATHEYPASPPPAQHGQGAPGPVQAVTAFARIYINWTAEDVAARMSQLARASIGQARSEMVLAAAETRVDSALHQGQISNRGSVEAVARLPGNRNRYVVVTREATSSAASGAYQGLAPAWHVTLATVTQTRSSGQRRWVLSAWQPQS